VGAIRAVTFSGIPFAISSGKMPSVSSAPSWSASASSTSPMITPRILTSAREGSCRPIFEVSSETSS
jgi:hypothetical protein